MTHLVELDHCGLIAADSAALADAAAANLAAPVQHCPGWSVADLVRHVYEVQDFWGQLVAGGLTDYEQADPTPQPADDELLDAFRVGADKLVGILAAADPLTPVWTWASRKDAGFVIRHQVQEAAVHRWDAQFAAGGAQPLDRDAAADAIEEFLTFSLRALPDGGQPLPGPRPLTAPDAGIGWTVGPDGDRLAWQRTMAGAPAPDEVRGTASDLLLLLYRRRTPDELVVGGDPAAAQALSTYVATD
jgi:uncharacterized protein (TIGR03083 family)